MCEAHKVGVRCQLEGSHPTHLIGYGKDRITWRNEDFKPLPPRITKGKLVEMARAIREAQEK